VQQITTITKFRQPILGFVATTQGHHFSAFFSLRLFYVSSPMNPRLCVESLAFVSGKNRFSSLTGPEKPHRSEHAV
jgi:hypothetical protein